MNFAFSFLFAALVVSMAVGKPASEVSLLSLTGSDITLYYVNSSGIDSLSTFYKSDVESFPTDWVAKFINPVDNPSRDTDYYIDSLLVLMDNRSSWYLTPYLSRHINAWNAQIRIPLEWRINEMKELNTMESTDGTIIASFYLILTGAGTTVIQSQFSDYQDNNPENLEIDLSKPLSLMYSNGKLTVTFMENRNSWNLEPNPGRRFNEWNVQIRIPNKWRIDTSMGQSYMLSNTTIMASCYLLPTRAGTTVIESHHGNYQSRILVNLEVDLTMPISLIYSDNKLVVTFSTRLIEQNAIRAFTV
ncbi:Protein of unknown function [Cotesia congregata]|uniref:Uncharacterized protein n=1 Tax=Cotesia congregata TaxID=51543 RepID=A0A8J2EBM8_COTCN|nr:Protein of unknown function [Cotesia congregata]